MDHCEVLESATLRISDGIISIVFEKNTHLSLKGARELVEARLKMSQNKDYPLFIDIRDLVSIDEDARKYLAGSEGVKYATCAAILIGNPLSKFLGNLFIMVDQPSKPTKLFTKKTTGLRWLKQYI